MAVVTRYFGGTKLGTGGLVRAYSGSVKTALGGLAVKEKRDLLLLTVTLDYAKVTAVQQLIKVSDGKIVDENYAAEVSFKVELPKNRTDEFIRAVTDLTGGAALFTK